MSTRPLNSMHRLRARMSRLADRISVATSPRDHFTHSQRHAQFLGILTVAGIVILTALTVGQAIFDGQVRPSWPILALSYLNLAIIYLLSRSNAHQFTAFYSIVSLFVAVAYSVLFQSTDNLILLSWVIIVAGIYVRLSIILFVNLVVAVFVALVVWQTEVTLTSYAPAVFSLALYGVVTVVYSRFRHQRETEREELIKRLDGYAHMMAHDIKNPLTVINGYTSMLSENWERLTPEQRNKYLNSILRVSRQLESIVDNLLLFASIQRTDSIELAPVNTQAVLQSVEERLAVEIVSQDVEITYPLTPWPTVTAHAPWLEDVWANYISNAIKYGGRPVRIELGFTIEEERMVRFWVRDNGSGIEADKLDKLFDKYVRLQTGIKGNGLGLQIVKALVSAMGGKVGVESVVGTGSTFSFTLPMDDQTASRSRLAENNPSGHIRQQGRCGVDPDVVHAS